jgi:hypothetical protein
MKIKAKLELKHTPVIEMETSRNWSQYIGWAAAFFLLVGIGSNTINWNKPTIRL